MKKLLLPVAFIVLAILLSGCMKPYQEEKYVDIEPNQTAFVIPLTGATSDQEQFESVDYLQDKQVATKRVEIPTKWHQQGRMWYDGKYIDTVKVIVVDRYPETREWSGEGAYVGESKDSIKFDQGASATAQILEEDTATFLYQYSGKTLKEVMDKEIRNKIGSVLLEKYSTMNIEEIRGDKAGVIQAVRDEVEPYFKERGITLSNIGYIGDLKYHDPAIQEAINKKFNAQEEKEAQEIINDKNEAQAESELAQAQDKAKAMETLEVMKELEIQEMLAKGLAEGKIILPQTLIMGESGEMIFDLPVVEKPSK